MEGMKGSGGDEREYVEVQNSATSKEWEAPSSQVH